MNPRLKDIYARRSIRAYTAETVSEEALRGLLEAAMAAPSACCTDPWVFIVVRDRQKLAVIARGLPNGKLLENAPLGLVVCGDMQRAHDGQESYMLQDCAAAIENMLLAAHMLGLGACWLGVHPRTERLAHIRSVLDLPEHVVPVSVLAVGRPAEEKPGRTRFTEAAVHYETFGK